MADDSRKKWYRLPKVSLNKNLIKLRVRKVESATVRHAHKFVVKRWSSVREVQWQVIVWVLIMGLLIAATGLQLMWYQQSYRTNVAAKDGTYAEAVLGPVDTLNPIFSTSSAEQSASRLMFSSLMSYDTTGHLNNDLVTNISVNDTHTVYTVQIRSDVLWHDGAKLTANDVAFTIGLINNPSVRSTISGWKDISVKVINDTTIEFTLPAVYAAFKHALTFPIMPEHILGKVTPSSIRENDFSQNPTGSGPFKLRLVQSIDASSSRKVIYLVRNDNYYGGNAKLARFQLHVYDTSDTIVKALALNEVNAAADLLPSDIKQVDKKSYAVSTKPIQSGVYAIVNIRSAILSDVTLRRALQVATDTSAIRSHLPSGTLALSLPFTDGQLSGDVPKVPDYDIVAAKKALDDAGWLLNSKNIREKDGKPLVLSVVTVKNSELEGVLAILSDQWRALGITISSQVINPSDVSQNFIQSTLQPRNYDVLLYQLNIGADPDVYAYWHSSQISTGGYNFANYSNVIGDDALSSARVRVELDLRNAKYITFVKQWISDVPAIGLYQSNSQYVTSSSVNSINSSMKLVSPIDRYSNILDWSVGSQSVYKTP
ncbi:MAG: peptide ABC transporter substrate-binding protein [Candidatus Saccharibacteria bacterium]